MMRRGHARSVWGGAGVLLAGLLLGAGCAPAESSPPPSATLRSEATPPLPTTEATPPVLDTPAPTPTAEVTLTPGPPVLKIEPPVLNLAVGQTGRVEVRAENMGPLARVELHLSFEPGYLRVEDSAPGIEGVQVELGALPQPSEVLQRSADNATGLVVYQVAQGAPAPELVSGVITAFTVRALAEGGSPLRFTIVTLDDADGQPLPGPDPVDGLVVISNAAATAEATVGEPSPAPAGETPQAPLATPSSAPAPTSPPDARSTPPEGTVYHTVQAGENLFRLALRYGTTVEAIVAANELSDAGQVRVGQVLVIPGGTGSGQMGGQTYVVQPGDTLFSIARRHNTTVQALAALNGLAEPYAIRTGQVLRLSP